MRFGDRLARARWPVRSAYVVVLFLATLSWYRLDLDPAGIEGRAGRMLDPSLSARDVVDGVRNVALFAGWGLVWMATAAAGRSWSALRSAVLSGAVLSLLVELLQLFSETRTASIVDVATNTFGAGLGAASLVLMVLGLAARRDEKSFLGLPTGILAISTGLAVLAEAFVPLYRQEIEPWGTGGPLRRLSEATARVRLGSPTEWPLGDLLLFLPAGVLAVAALGEMRTGYRRAAVQVAVASVILFGLAEVAHGALGMEVFAGAAVVHAVAVAVGGLAAAWGLPRFTRLLRGASRPRAVTVSYTIWLCLWALRPYSPEVSWSRVGAKLAGDWWVPLRFLGSRTDMFSVVDVVVGFFLLLPLGALLAVWPLRLRGALSGVLPALYVAAGLEMAQILVAGRTLDVTDFLIQAAGAAIGWVVVRRAGYRPYGQQLP